MIFLHWLKDNGMGASSPQKQNKNRYQCRREKEQSRSPAWWTMPQAYWNCRRTTKHLSFCRKAGEEGCILTGSSIKTLNSVEGKGVGMYFRLSWPHRCISTQWEGRIRIKHRYWVSSTSNQFFTTKSHFIKSNAMAANHWSRTLISLLESAGRLPVNRFSTFQCLGPVLTWIVNENIDLAPKSFHLRWRRTSYSRQKKSRESQEAVLIN